MGLLRLVFIFIGLATCSEIPVDDGTSMFRSYFAFFIMLVLDYSRMFFKGRSKYEKGVGIAGLIFTLIQVTLNWMAASKSLVLHKDETAYVITPSSTFRMFTIHLNVDDYIQWTAIITMFIAALELTIPFVNRYSLRKKDEERKPKEKRGFQFRWRLKQESSQLDKVPLDGQVAKTSVEGGK